jgi:MFS family permease
VQELLHEANGNDDGISVWRHPSGWLRGKKLSREYWIFFTAALFFNFGFSIYYFLFNLYLVDLHFNDRAIGLIAGATTLGSVVGTLPAGAVARKVGLRLPLLACFIAAPALSFLRLFSRSETVLMGIGFLVGLSMSVWAVCSLPAIARTTTEENRPTGFSLISSASIATVALGGLACGYMQQWLRMAGFVIAPYEVKRMILMAACFTVALGIFAVVKMSAGLPERVMGADGDERHLAWWQVNPFLWRFLPAMILWMAVLTAFGPFANVYLSKELHVPLLRIGLVFSAAQIVQLCSSLMAPLLFRKLGMVNGIVVTQLTTALLLGALASTQSSNVAVALYLGFSAMQWMSNPGLNNLLMNRVPDAERSTATAVVMFCDALVGAASTAGAGILFTRFGYPRVLLGIAALAATAPVVLRIFLQGDVTIPITNEIEV